MNRYHHSLFKALCQCHIFKLNQTHKHAKIRQGGSKMSWYIHKFYLGFRTDRLKTIVTYVNSVMQLKCDSVIIFG
jgi:hypothetical protein